MTNGDNLTLAIGGSVAIFVAIVGVPLCQNLKDWWRLKHSKKDNKMQTCNDCKEE
jgi:hypothetical protein